MESVMQRKYIKPAMLKTFIPSNSGNAEVCAPSSSERWDNSPKMGSFYGPDPSAGPFDFHSNTAFD